MFDLFTYKQFKHFYIMEENFGKLIQLLACFNALHKGIGDGILFTYKIEGEWMYIYGCTGDLGNLISLLWANTTGFNFYFHKDCIRVLI